MDRLTALILVASSALCNPAVAQEAGHGYSVVTPEYLDSIKTNGDWELGGMSIHIRPSTLVRDFVVKSPATQANSCEMEAFNYRDFREKQKAYGIKYPWEMLAPYADRFTVSKRRIDQPLALPQHERLRAENELRNLVEQADLRLRNALANGESQEKVEALTRELQTEINAKQQLLIEQAQRRSQQDMLRLKQPYRQNFVPCPAVEVDTKKRFQFKPNAWQEWKQPTLKPFELF